MAGIVGDTHRLDWALDVTRPQDQRCMRAVQGAANVVVVRHLTVNLSPQQRSPHRQSSTGKRLKADWDNDCLLIVLAAIEMCLPGITAQTSCILQPFMLLFVVGDYTISQTTLAMPAGLLCRAGAAHKQRRIRRITMRKYSYESILGSVGRVLDSADARSFAVCEDADGLLLETFDGEGARQYAVKLSLADLVELVEWSERDSAREAEREQFATIGARDEGALAHLLGSRELVGASR